MTPESIPPEILLALRRLYVDGFLTTQQYKTLRGQALAGDIEGARKGMMTILRQNNSIEIIRRAVIDDIPGK